MSSRAATRQPILAGAWYPRDPLALAAQADAFLAGGARVAASLRPTGARAAPLAVVAPHAGYAYAGAIAGHAYAALLDAAAAAEIQRVIILAPSHYDGFRGASLAEVDAWETPLGAIPLPSGEERARLRRQARLIDYPEADRREHALEIQLPLLQRALGNSWTLVPITIGQPSHRELVDLGRALRPWCDAHTLVVASTDFTHYGARFDYLPFPPSPTVASDIAALDAGAVAHILARDGDGLLAYRERTGITMCGILPVVAMLATLPADAVGVDLAYDTSGRQTDDPSASVSYRALAFWQRHGALALDAAREEILIAAVRDELAATVAGRPRRSVPGEDDAWPAADVFVTLDVAATGTLRGCMGSIDNPRPLPQAVRAAATSAATRDPRFPAVTEADLDGLDVEISVLTPPAPITPAAIVLGRHGLILELDDHRGLFLPQVAIEHSLDTQEFLAALERKADLPRGAHRDPRARLTAFEAIVIGPRAARSERALA